MLAEQVGQEIGQITGTRVLPPDGGRARVEVSFQATGRMLDADITDIGTYESVDRPDGSMVGHGQGFLMTAAGDSVNWTGRGLGHMTAHGVSWRGSLFYETTSERFARMNHMMVVFEFEVDESGKTTARHFEWK